MPILKSRFALALIPLALLLAIPVGTAQSPHDAFSPGETMTFDVTWTVFRAGVVTSTIRQANNNNHPTFELTATAKSEGFVPMLFDVDDVFHATTNPQTLCSESVTKAINEGHRHKDTHIAFDYARQKAVLNERDLNLPNSAPKHTENDIPPCVQDVVTAFYFLRRQKLEIGHNIELPVNDGSKTQHVVVEVQAREKVQTPMGTFEAFRLEPKVFNGLFKRKGRMLIWLSADERQLPLRIKALIAIGSLTGTLRSVTYPREEPAPPAHH